MLQLVESSSCIGLFDLDRLMKNVLQESEREQNDVSVSTPEECNVYSQQAIFLRLCSEERHDDPT
jgi:hypothetical protein